MSTTPFNMGNSDISLNYYEAGQSLKNVPGGTDVLGK